VDAEDNDKARVVAAPVPWNVTGGQRPCFQVTKKEHASAFNLYYATYDQLFRNKARSL